MNNKKHLIVFLLVLSVILTYILCSCSSDSSNKELTTIQATQPATEVATEETTRHSYVAKANFIEDKDVDIVNTPSAGRFCYNQLSDEEKLCYEKMRIAISEQRKGLYWNNRCCTPDELDDLLMWITYDYPEYFWYATESCYAERVSSNVAYRINLHYEYTKDEVAEIQKEIDKVTNKYLNSTKNLKTDYDKALNTYEYIINNTYYDNVRATAGYTMFSQMDSKETLACWNISGVLLNKTAICRGYAQTYQYLMNLQGIECGYVYGDDHCWNIVKLDGDWYYVDTTWGDPVLESVYSVTGEKVYTEMGIDYSCFGMTTEQLLKLHKPDEDLNLELPICTATKYNYFVKNGITQ